ncbi:DUF5819 family protein [Streptomyces polyrhachis]|uniref:DUF5819 family protein n=1 Tax=Streptomyces polyrhachis TaxID=1282885 RepID=A0ABW2G8V3_9ACTN
MEDRERQVVAATAPHVTGETREADGADIADPEAAAGGATAGEDAGEARLSPLSRAVISVALAAVTLLTALHLGTLFLHIAPPNTVSKEHQGLIADYVYPEFEQNWKLFAPNPLQTNIHVQVRARVNTGGELTDTEWIDLSAQDGAAIRHNPFPSHTDQNQLRRAWEYYLNSHNEKNEPLGERGGFSKAYLKRIVLLRLGPEHDGARLESVQLRGTYTAIPRPPYTGEKTDTKTTYRTLPWWRVTSGDLQPGDLRRWEEAAK